jgi:peptidoglycan/xylan/chitin deacetylase (PgdA/CDA1 family)
MRALSLEYHDVVPDGDFGASGFRGAGPDSYKLTRSSFESHLSAIAAATDGARRVHDEGAAADGARPLLLTFDDGGRGALTEAAAALEARGWRGHFFVTSGRVGTPGFLTAAEVRELAARGHVVGSHSDSHPTLMGALPAARIREEWVRSVGLLGDVLGRRVTTASVPGGFYTHVVGQAAAEAGLEWLFTSWPTTRTWTVGPCRVLGRYTIRRWTSARQAAALAAGDVAPRLAQWAWYRSLHLARTVAGDHYTRVRQLFWARHAS